MARIDTLGNFLTDVAEAIRTKEGTTETIAASEFDTRISNLSGGGSEDLTEELTTYGDELEEQDVTLDDITKALRNKASGAIVTDYKPIYLKFEGYGGTDLGTTVSNLDTSELTSMQNLFKQCTKLSTIDVSRWNTSKATSMYNMF